MVRRCLESRSLVQLNLLSEVWSLWTISREGPVPALPLYLSPIVQAIAVPPADVVDVAARSLGRWET